MKSVHESPRKRILIVDDESAVLEILELGLSPTYQVTKAGSGREGLREFEREPFDLVISDRAMPEMNGEEFAAAVKAHTPETPIILISGFDASAVDHTHFAAFLKKPFRMKDLMDTVDGLTTPCELAL